EIVGGSVQVRGTPSRSVSLGEIAVALIPAGARRLEMEPETRRPGWFEVTHMAYPYGLHLAVVRIDLRPHRALSLPRGLRRGSRRSTP
ncbi:MAG: hypothetical protein U5K29_15025, partial [Acidimicrobiales bacterium]|nr:hypothetical protein [Acidimicrobiales bacterium]